MPSIHPNKRGRIYLPYPILYSQPHPYFLTHFIHITLKCGVLLEDFITSHICVCFYMELPLNRSNAHLHIQSRAELVFGFALWFVLRARTRDKGISSLVLGYPRGCAVIHLGFHITEWAILTSMNRCLTSSRSCEFILHGTRTSIGNRFSKN